MSSSVADWRAQVVDFICVRGSAIFRDWSVNSIPDLVRLLSRRDWDHVLSCNVLASSAFAADIRLAQRLVTRELQQHQVHSTYETASRFSGRPAVRETLLIRLRKGQMVWVVADRRKDWQTLANGAIVAFLVFLLGEADRASKIVASSVDGTVILVRRLLATEPMRRVRPGSDWINVRLPDGLTAKSEFYRMLWRYAVALRRARRSRDATLLREQILNGWLRAEEDDRLLELFAFTKIVETLYASGMWNKFEIFGIADNSGLTVRCERPGLVVDVCLDRSVRDIPAAYDYIMERYEYFGGKPLRPDLQVRIRLPDHDRTLLVEAKATELNSQYRRESVVKVLGYLKNYETLWSSADRYPKALLLFGNPVGPKDDISERVQRDDLIVSDTEHFTSDFLASFNQIVAA